MKAVDEHFIGQMTYVMQFLQQQRTTAMNFQIKFLLFSKGAGLSSISSKKKLEVHELSNKISPIFERSRLVLNFIKK